MTISYSKSVFTIKENAQFTIYEDDLDNIVWHDDNPTNITNEQILEKQVELQSEYDAEEWKRNRQLEYPSIEECVHAILDDTLTELQTKRADIKLKYPKGS